MTFFLIFLSSAITNPKSNLDSLFLEVKITSNKNELLYYLNSFIASDFLVYPFTNDVNMIKLSSIDYSLIVSIYYKDKRATMYNSSGSFSTFI